MASPIDDGVEKINVINATEAALLCARVPPIPAGVRARRARAGCRKKALTRSTLQMLRRFERNPVRFDRVLFNHEDAEVNAMLIVFMLM
jgi:hypothetical protein